MRLRKHYGPFRYYMCGEYGGKTSREHYHALIFGLDFKDDRTFLKTAPSGEPLYTSESLNKIWGKGFVPIGDMSFSAAKYVAKYVMKKANGLPEREQLERVSLETGEVWHVAPEFQTMSRRPGLGHEWFEKYGHDVYPSDQVIVDGKPHQPPAYYDKLLGRKAPELLETIKKVRAENAVKFCEHESPKRRETRQLCQERSLKANPRHEWT